MNNHQIAQQILALKKRKEHAWELFLKVHDSYVKPGGHTERPGLIKQLRRYTNMPGREGIVARQLLQEALVHDQRHWTQTDSPWNKGIDPYTSMDDPSEDGFILLEPEGYIEYDDGEKLGYQQVRWLYDIIEDKPEELRAPQYKEFTLGREPRIITPSEPYDPKIARAANTYIGVEPHDELPEEDREHEPEGFKPDFVVNWDDVQNFTAQHSQELFYLKKALRKWAETKRDTCLEDVPFSLILPPMEPQTRHYIVRGLARSAMYTLPHTPWVNKEDAAEHITEMLTKRWGFIEDFELPDFDGIDGDPITEEEHLTSKDYDFEEYIKAPIVRIEFEKLRSMWNQNKRMFPNPRRIDKQIVGNYAELRLRFEADYDTLSRLLALAGTPIDPKTAHQRTPAFQRILLRSLMGGAGISEAYSVAWRDYRPLREQTPYLMNSVQEDYAVVERWGRESKMHLAAMSPEKVALEPGQLRAIIDRMEKFPNLAAFAV